MMFEERDFSDDEDHEYETDYVYNDTSNRKYDAYGARNEDERYESLEKHCQEKCPFAV